MPAKRKPAAAADKRIARAPASTGDRRTAASRIADERMRDYFLGWQCRIRQISMRQHAGRPTPGMSAKVFLPTGRILVPAMTIVLVPLEPTETTAYLRFNVLKSNDPRVIYEKGLAFLQSTYFQQPKLFDGDPTALFAPGAATAEALLGAGEVVLEFEDYGQTFRMIARARRLKPRDKAFQATLWHNRTFNPEIPNTAEVLSFAIEWQSAQAHPEPP